MEKSKDEWPDEFILRDSGRMRMGFPPLVFRCVKGDPPERICYIVHVEKPYRIINDYKNRSK